MVKTEHEVSNNRQVDLTDIDDTLPTKADSQCVICGNKFPTEDFMLVHQAEEHAEHAEALGFTGSVI